MNYRFKHDKNIIRFPQGFTEEDRGLKSCCDPFLVLASETSNNSWENDLTGVYIKASDPGDIVEFKITNCDFPTPLDNLGEVGIFPQDDLAVGFIYDWKQYLLTYGAGLYTISVEFTISGVTGGYMIGQYLLKPFSIYNASGTVRVKALYNSFYELQLVDFTNSNFVDTVRFEGFFGKRQPKTDVKNYITKGRKVAKSTRENLNEYELESDPVGICITRKLLDHFVNEDSLFISDHNKYNHDYLLFDIPVVLEETSELEYKQKNRWAQIKATFGQRDKLDKSYYNNEQ